MLSKVIDLDQLLNYNYGSGAQFSLHEAHVLVNNLYLETLVNVPNEISKPQKTLYSVLLTWDEQSDTDRESLTPADTKFTMFYAIIGQVANAVLLKIDEAEGDPLMAKRLKAEAYVLRAYFHYLAVNFYAKAYHPETAAIDGGVPYAKETDLFSIPNKKYTVQEVYDFILDDLDAALALNSLPDEPVNLMRVGKAFAYAVQAKVLISMHRFDDALKATEASLAVKNGIDDHRKQVDLTVKYPEINRPRLKSSEDLFFSTGGAAYRLMPTAELKASFEPGSVFYQCFLKGDDRTYDKQYGVDGPVIRMQNTYFNATGLTTIDMYLTKAECLIRTDVADKISEAMGILNSIREKRILSTEYTPATVANATEAFALLKRISRTENWFGGKYYIDLKRWNTEDVYKETLRKTLVGVDYELAPDSPLWIFPFPQNATGFNPNLTQNY